MTILCARAAAAPADREILLIMKSFVTVCVEIAGLCGLALVLGFGVNAVRGRESIRVARDYFPKEVAVARVPGAPARVAPAAAEPDDPTPVTVTGDTPDAVSVAEQSPAGDQTASVEAEEQTVHFSHEFQEVSFKEVKAIFEDPNTRAGVNLFIDARGDDAYADGHIPGAIQCDHYRFDEYFDGVFSLTECAEKVVVYCSGGECEDSVLLCRDLLGVDVCYEKLYLFRGGCVEWSANGMPCRKGEEP